MIFVEDDGDGGCYSTSVSIAPIIWPSVETRNEALVAECTKIRPGLMPCILVGDKYRPPQEWWDNDDNPFAGEPEYEI